MCVIRADDEANYEYMSPGSGPAKHGSRQTESIHLPVRKGLSGLLSQIYLRPCRKVYTFHNHLARTTLTFASQKMLDTQRAQARSPLLSLSPKADITALSFTSHTGPLKDEVMRPLVS